MGDVLVQLSDLHVQAVGDPAPDAAAERLERARTLVERLDPAPAAVLITGDLVNSGDAAQLERLQGLLEPWRAFDLPVLPMVGNHDDRAALRHACETWPVFAGVQLADGPWVQHVTQLAAFRIIALDTQVAGAAAGALCPERRAWLAEQLAAAPDAPTIIAMHHPPVPLGMPAFDDIALDAADAAALAELLVQHPQVERIVCGHVHRTVTARLAHVPVFACPSVFWPARVDLRPGLAITLVEGPVGIGLHVRCADGSLASHARMIGPVPHAVTLPA